MIKLKVLITLVTQQELWGYLYLSEVDDKHKDVYQRVQDVLNDDRPFLPVNVLQDRQGKRYDDEYKVVMFNKSSIMKVEEIR